MEDRVSIKLFTDKRVYDISAVSTGEDKHGYLGCISGYRAPLPGETWFRGKDLADGPLTYQTWIEILEDIVKSELLPISDYILKGDKDE